MNSQDRTTAIPALPNQAGLANVPGLRRLWLIEARHVLHITDPRTVPGSLVAGWVLPGSAFSLTPDAVIHDWRFSSKRGRYEEKVTTTVQGIQYDQDIKLTLPRDAPETTLTVMRMTGRKWLAIYTDGNGLLRLVGTPKQPLRFAQALNLTNNSRELIWVGSTRNPSVFLSDSDATALSTFLAFRYDFEIS